MHLPHATWESELSIAPDADFLTNICEKYILYDKNANLQLTVYSIRYFTDFTKPDRNRLK